MRRRMTPGIPHPIGVTTPLSGSCAAGVKIWRTASGASMMPRVILLPAVAATLLSGTCPAAAADSAYAARGNEPGWSLEIAQDRITLVTDYGAARITVPRPAEQTVPGGRRYDAATEAHRLRVAIDARTCADTMSGMPYPDHVTVTIDGRNLTGCGGDPATLLQGRRWSVREVAGSAIPRSAGADGSPPTLVFALDGRLSGTTGCNAYRAAFAVTGEGLSIGPVVTTRRACPPGLLQREAAFLKILGTAARHEMPDDGMLVVHGADGRTIVAAQE
mgnify:CR=1 FL=1